MLKCDLNVSSNHSHNGNLPFYKYKAEEALVDILKVYYKNIYREGAFKSNELVCAYNDEGFYTVCCEDEKTVKICYYNYDDYNIARNLKNSEGKVIMGNNVSMYYVIEYLQEKKNDIQNGKSIIFNEDEKGICKLRYKTIEEIFNCIHTMEDYYISFLNDRIEFYTKIMDYDRELKEKQKEKQNKEL